MKKHGRTDANQSAIVKALRQSGASVLILSSIGSGCPDLLCGRSGFNILLEVKDPSAAKSDRQLTPDQKEFHATWRGAIAVVETAEQALKLIGGSGR